MKYPWNGEVQDGQALPLDGLASKVKENLRQRVVRLVSRGQTPGLGTLLVGDDPGSAIYVAAKHRDCEEVGIRSFDVRLPADATAEQVEEAIDAFNADPECTAFIIQLPLPDHLDSAAMLRRMNPAKDADGLHPYNLGILVDDVDGTSTAPRPCTPRGIVDLLKANCVELKGARVCVVGRGLTVGRPLGLMLTSRDVGATAILCHTGTKDLDAELRQADVIVAAAGVPELVREDAVKPGAVVVDVGVARRDGKIAGDIAPGVENVAAAMTPNPGGVGPMTRAMLLTNVVEIAEQARRR